MGSLTKGTALFACVKRVSVALVLLSSVISLNVPVGAADAQPLKAITPHMDPDADRKAEPRKPFQIGVEHTEKAETPRGKPLKANAADSGGALRSGVQKDHRGLLGKLRGGAKTDNTRLNARANNVAPLQAQMQSSFGIIGVKFVLALGKPPVINRVFPGTPAYTVGLQKDDAIVAVDGVPTFGLSKEEVYDLIIGSPGTKVNVSIMRSGDFRVVTCTRMDINELTDPVVRRDYLMSM